MVENITLNDSKLLLLLQHLDKKETKELGLWLRSPIHNTSEDVIKLYEGIQSKHRNFKKPIFRIDLLKHLDIKFPKAQKHISPQHEKQLRQVMYKLTIQIQDFLIWKRGQVNNTAAKRHLMDALLEKKLYQLVPPILTKAKKELEAQPIRDMQFCDNSFQLIEMEFYISVLTRHRNKPMSIEEVVNALRQSFFSKLLKYYCAAANYQKILKTKKDYPLMGVIKQHVENSIDREIPIIRVYHTLLKLTQDEKQEDFYDLKNYLFNHLEAFDSTEIRQFFNFMCNYCNFSILNGKKELIKEVHAIHQKGIELKCWSTGIYFSEHQFIHIIKNALILDKKEWVNTFVEHHHELLNPNVHHNIFNYSKALIAFQHQQFEDVQDYLIKINNSEDFVYHVEYKILYIKIYYDSNKLNIDNIDTHPINYELEAIRHYVRPEKQAKMSETSRLIYNNFVNLFRRILERKKKHIMGETLTQQSIQRLHDELPTIQPLAERDWLEEKIVELLKES